VGKIARRSGEAWTASPAILPTIQARIGRWQNRNHHLREVIA